ncbi:hypothetical protein NPIL_150471 [Nephila pilipes]|uniref:Secreted protein n=1 Tax=Nephila pilipes TaxID=299642 RepID=A0A8X6T9T8_NEPPI|nr:hypothetical protein NPIL_150471 [Nephila pilipes]
MRAVFLIFLLIALIAMTMATVHHHVVEDDDKDGGGSIKYIPYEALYRTHVKVGLETSSYWNDPIEHIRTEQELQTFTKTDNNASENTNIKIEDSLMWQ